MDQERSIVENSDLIPPHDLNVDATIPQCLDDQYLSDDVLEYMLENRVGYSDPSVSEMRRRNVDDEFFRSLIYSSQVIINRAFLKNNRYLFSYYSKEKSEDLQAFSDLVLNQHIVPFLAKEKSLTHNLNLNVSEEGDAALAKLLDKTGDNIKCLRLAQNDAKNEKAVSFLYTGFGGYLNALNSYDKSQFLEMAGELFNRELDHEQFNLFCDNVKKLSAYAFDKGQVTRKMVYMDWFARKGSTDKETEANVTEGLFLRPTNENHLLELKKLVDLRYNTNLSDLLNRYSFTPINMPSRIALQDKPDLSFQQISNKEVKAFVDSSISYLKRIFVADKQRGMYLPLLRNLRLHDIAKIHNFDEWEIFINEQQKVLSNPLKMLELIDGFQNAFINLQTKISNWYLEEHDNRPKENRSEKGYSPFVTIGLQVGGQSIVFGLANLIGIDTDDVYSQVLGSGIGNVLGYNVQLMLNMINLDKMEVDKDLSYSIDIMRNDQIVTRDEIEFLIRKIQEIGGDSIVADGQMADQTKGI